MLPADTRLNKPRWGIVGLSGGLRMLGTAYQAPLELIIPEDTRGFAFAFAQCLHGSNAAGGAGTPHLH